MFNSKTTRNESSEGYVRISKTNGGYIKAWKTGMSANG